MKPAAGRAAKADQEGFAEVRQVTDRWLPQALINPAV